MKFPTIYCKCCNKNASKVCVHPACEQYPFVCDENFKKCKNNPFGNINSIHYSHSSERLVTIQYFREKLQSLGQDIFQDDKNQIKSLVRWLRSQLQSLLNIYINLVEDEFDPLPTRRSNQIMDKIKRPSNTPDLVGRDIHYILDPSNFYDQKDPSFVHVMNKQRKFKGLLRQLSSLITDFKQERDQEIIIVSDCKESHASEPQKQPPSYIIQSQNNQTPLYTNGEHCQFVPISSGDENECENDSKKVIKSKMYVDNVKNFIQKYEKQVKKKILKSWRKWIFQELEKAVQLDSLNWEAQFLLGQYSYLTNRSAQKSLKYYENALKIKPDYAFIYNGIGLIHQQKGRHTMSIKYFDRALELEENSFFYSNKGSSLFHCQKYQEAVECFSKAIERSDIKEDKAQYYNYRGECYYSMGENAKAKSDFSLALTLDPQNLQHQGIFKKICNTNKKLQKQKEQLIAFL